MVNVKGIGDMMSEEALKLQNGEKIKNYDYESGQQ
jgi:hypothetical protein